VHELLKQAPMASFTIPADKLPNKSASVTVKEPTFKDRREAAKRYPTNANYPIEDLLLGLCITHINDQDVLKVPTDPIKLVRQFPHADAQYLSAVFLTMFTLDEELSEQAQNLGSTFKTSIQENCTISKEQMPIGEFSITFVKPHLGDRHQAEKVYPGADSSCGYSLEELLFARSILAVNGEKPNHADPIDVLNEFPHLEAQFAVAVFLNAITLNKADVNEAQQLGKSLRDQFRSGGQDESPKSTKSKKSATTTQA
jgi:hypothetical protein